MTEEKTKRVTWRGIPVNLATVNDARFRPWSAISGTDLQHVVLAAVHGL